MIDTVATVRHFYELARAGDWDKAEALLSDDLVIYEAMSLPFGGEWCGKDAFRRLVEAVMSHWLDPEVIIDAIIGDEQYAVAIIRFTMTSKATGERFVEHVSEVSRISDGQIVEMRIHYFDTAEVARQAGFRQTD